MSLETRICLGQAKPQESGCGELGPGLISMHMKNQTLDESLDYERITKAIRFMEAHYQRQPDLGRIAASVHLSPHHFQRVFKRWAGISPKKFLQSLTLAHSQRQLRAGASLLSATLDTGLSGTGRLHDLFVTFQGMTPAEFKAEGAGLEIRYGLHPSPFGHCLLGITERGICWLSFGSKVLAKELKPLKDNWPSAVMKPDQETTEKWVKRIFPGNGRLPESRIPVLAVGSDFQLQVWRALLGIPVGAAVSYGELAAKIGRPQAVRALGTAVGQNAVAYLIPCHRVIRAGGHFGQYRWGAPRKAMILRWEQLDGIRNS